MNVKEIASRHSSEFMVNLWQSVTEQNKTEQTEQTI